MGLNNTIRSLCKEGKLTEALCLLQKIGPRLKSSTYACLSQACGRNQFLAGSKILHSHIIIQGSPESRGLSLRNSMVSMYVRCKTMDDAHHVVDEMLDRDVITWTTMISGYARQGNAIKALQLFHQMQTEGIQFNNFTCASVLRACADLQNVDMGRHMHFEAILRGFCGDDFICSALVSFYARCGRVKDARQVFDKMHCKDLVVWNSMIVGYVKNGENQNALDLFWEMRKQGILPDHFSFSSIIPACNDMTVLERIYEEVKEVGFEHNIFVANGLVDMFSKTGNLQRARRVFDGMCERDVISWNSMISGYAQNGELEHALELFHRFPKPDIVTWNAVLEGYLYKGLINDALDFFRKMPERDVISWSCVISGLVGHGRNEEALTMFYDLLNTTDIRPDSFIFASVLPACSNLQNLDHGKRIHEEAVRGRFETDDFIGSALVDMYCKCHDLDSAMRVAEKVSRKDVVLWTALISGYAHGGRASEALNLFREMQAGHIKADGEAFSAVLVACSGISSLKLGKELHAAVIRADCADAVVVGSALVDMYVKCGSIACARQVFERMSIRSVASWNAMIMGYALHGLSSEAFQAFENMLQQSCLEPDDITFLALLSASCHTGMVDRGWQYYRLMVGVYQIVPRMEHYTCMVNLLARAGLFQEAQDFINCMHLNPNSTVWKCFLAACKTYNNVHAEKFAAERLLDLEPESTLPYDLPSDFRFAAGE